MLKSRKPSDAHPLVDPETFTKWVKYTVDRAANNVEVEKKKAERR